MPKKTDAKTAPELAGSLRKHSIKVPEGIYQCTGINIMGTRIKSILFSTDLAIVSNNNAQAIFCVYPFTPQINITSAVIQIARCPVFVGVGGGTTSGERVLSIALHSELLGACGVVVNAPMSAAMIRRLKAAVDIPVVATVCSPRDDFMGKVAAGADILNVSAAAQTPQVIGAIRAALGQQYPIIATGGPTEDTIAQTIQAGANAITYTPPTSAELFHELMNTYRQQ